MLAVAGSDKNLEVVKFLINNNKADVSSVDFAGNTLLHLAVTYGNIDILEYLVVNLKLNIFERNNSGETPLSIAESKKLERATKLLEKSKNVYDQTKIKSDELLKEL